MAPHGQQRGLQTRLGLQFGPMVVQEAGTEVMVGVHSDMVVQAMDGVTGPAAVHGQTAHGPAGGVLMLAQQALGLVSDAHTPRFECEIVLTEIFRLDFRRLGL